jgi:D-alanyl-lipoteichoic acid acyltransferase DltB (MBOAT superfamily)
MVFNSIPFIAFFLAVYALYRVLPHRGQNWLLLVASYVFYASWDWRFLGLLVACTTVAYGCALLLGRIEDARMRRLVLIAGLGVHLALLGFFKYFNFFAGNLQALLSLAGWRTDGLTLKVLLPVGVSFYTFVAMSYVIDVYRRQVDPCRNLVDVAAFIGFFPTLLAGPIVRASTLLRQIHSPRSSRAGQAAEGSWLILWGYFKKMYVADNLARVVNQVYGAGSDPGSLAIVLATVAFAFQLYGDFSGYSDIARGISKLLRIELNVNFRFPYFVRTPQEFWTHWHISLSEWLRDYLFLPLSFIFSRRMDGVRWLGLRDDFWIYGAATMVTMALAGLWHGAAWTFVLWGVYQGLLLVVFRLVALLRRGRGRHRSFAPWKFTWKDLPGALGMFALTCYGWLLFRSESWSQAVDLTGRLLAGSGVSWRVGSDVGIPLLVYTGPMLALHLAEAARGDLDAIPRSPLVVRYSVYAALVYVIVLFSDFRGSEFIYFQF